MASVLLVDNDEARGTSIKQLLEWHGFSAVVYPPDTGNISDLRSYPADAIFFAPGVVPEANASSTGRFVFADPERIDRRRLDVILLFGLQRFYGQPSSYFIGPLSEN